MDLASLMKERRSVVAFADRPVPPGLLAELLDTAVWAPNHHVTEPWRFAIITGEARQTLAAINPAIDPGTPAFVVVIMREDHRPLKREEDYAATCCVVQNFHLLAWEKGLGMVWKTYGLMYDERFRQAFGIRAGEKVVGVLHVGYPAQVPPAKPRTPAAERITLFDEEVPV